MIREFHLSDALTLLNAGLGMSAVLAFMRFLVDHRVRFFWLGTAALPLALVMDVLDGRIARWRRKSSPLGQELDSLADIVSFGVAPAAMGFAAGLRGGWDVLILVYFVACGISRLARYNVTAASLADEAGKVRYFEGMPIPSSLLVAAIVAGLAAAGRWQDRMPGLVRLGPFALHAIALLYLAHGSAMISKTLHVPKP
jgi:CDP-diacylglycerol--serine O-phosphatidyltransferase